MKILLLVLSLINLWATPAAVAETPPTQTTQTPQNPAPLTKSLSPYFFVEGDEGGEKFPLKKTEVSVNIAGVFAEVTVRQRYANMGAAPINARYIFPGSTRAAVQELKMTVGERTITAQIKEKEEARRTWQQAKRQGKRAALLEQQRPNVFSMDVANIMPGEEIAVELRYSELLVPQAGVYEFVYPAVVGPRYAGASRQSDNQSSDNQSNTWLANPYLRSDQPPHTAFDLQVSLVGGMTLQDVSCPQNQVTTTFTGKKRAHIALAGNDFAGDRDFILRYRLQGGAISTGLIVQRATPADPDNWFLLMAQPPQRVQPADIPPREYLFVVDVSGSMHGFPLETAKALLRDLLTGLRPADRFNVLLFASDSALLSPTSLPVSQANLLRAQNFIDHAPGSGGTELLSALTKALALPQHSPASRSIVVVTDGYISAEKELFTTVEKNLHHANLFAFGIGSSVNRYLIEGLARAGQGEPFIVTEPNAAAPTAARFRDYISAPLLTGITTHCTGVELRDLEPPAQPDLFAARPLVQYGRFTGEQADARCTVSGRSGSGAWSQQVQFAGAEQVHSGLDTLWARTRIARLDDYGTADRDTIGQVTALGLRYGLLTRYTSFVAVDEVVANPGTADHPAQDVRQPLPLPAGVSNLAVDGNAVPEPELPLLALAALLLLAVSWHKRSR